MNQRFVGVLFEILMMGCFGSAVRERCSKQNRRTSFPRNDGVGVRTLNGFTLIEFILVIILMGILMMVVIPRFKASDYDDLYFSNHLIQALRYAQTLAVDTGCTTQLSVDNNHVFWLKQLDGCTSGSFAAAVFNPGTNQPNFSFATPSSLVVTSTDLPIVFNAVGRALDGGGDVFDTEAIITLSHGVVHIVGESGYAYLAAI